MNEGEKPLYHGPRSAKYRRQNAVLAHALTDDQHVTDFIDRIKAFVSTVKRQQAHVIPKKRVNIVVSITLGEDTCGPLVDLEWASAALPCSLPHLRGLLVRVKDKLNPAMYKRIVTASGKRQRVRLLSLHDLKVLRGALLCPGKGKEAARLRGELL